MALLTSVDAAHWESWLTAPVQFAAALDLVARRARGAPLCALQTGPHPVLDGAVAALGATAGVQLVAQAASLRRKVPALAFIREQRAALAAAGVLAPALRAALSRPGALQVEAGSKKVTLELGAPFPEQGLASAHYPALARRLALFFPGLKPHDLYRFTSVAALLEGWDAAPDAAAATPTLGAHAAAALEILGSGVRLPPCVRSAQACWDALSAETCAIDDCPIEGFKASPSGFLQPPFSKAEAKAACADPKLAISPPEANCMDPQQALALQLVDELWKDVGEVAAAAVLSNRERVGVYIGAWQPPGFQAKSAYAALGATLSALAARVANSYDLQGPALTLNTARLAPPARPPPPLSRPSPSPPSSQLHSPTSTPTSAPTSTPTSTPPTTTTIFTRTRKPSPLPAPLTRTPHSHQACSSSLVAVDCALKDARAGLIDFAIVGGINLIAGPGGEQQFEDLKRATMLSPTFRCHTFSEAADGYVRAEGGVLFLLRSTSAPPLPEGAPTPSARIVGAATNQNSQRRPMTAVDPIAQERVVRAACANAGLLPSALDAIEMHGTGTKLGDPVELSALARVTAAAPSGQAAAPKRCVVTAAKMHFGHLESAAGALGLLKVPLPLPSASSPTSSDSLYSSHHPLLPSHPFLTAPTTPAPPLLPPPPSPTGLAHAAETRRTRLCRRRARPQPQRRRLARPRVWVASRAARRGRRDAARRCDRGREQLRLRGQQRARYPAGIQRRGRRRTRRARRARCARCARCARRRRPRGAAAYPCCSGGAQGGAQGLGAAAA